DVDVTALPGHGDAVQRGAGRHADVDAAQQVGYGRVGGRQPARRVAQADEVGHARLPLDGDVECGPVPEGSGGAEAAERAGDDPGVDGGQRVVVDLQLGGDAGPVVVDHDVGGAHELVEGGEAVGMRQLQGDAALAPVHAQEERVHPVDLVI